MDQLIFKRLKPDDIDQWFTMRLKSLKDCPSSFLASPETEVLSGADFFKSRIIDGGHNNVIFACFSQNACVGSIGIVRENHIKAIHKANIWGMYVAPEFRRKKIAHKLLEQAISHAKENMKVELINLSVESSQEPAKNLYSSFGFKVWGHESNAMFVDGKYYDEDYMVLDLKSKKS